MADAMKYRECCSFRQTSVPHAPRPCKKPNVNTCSEGERLDEAALKLPEHPLHRSGVFFEHSIYYDHWILRSSNHEGPNPKRENGCMDGRPQRYITDAVGNYDSQGDPTSTAALLLFRL